MTDYDKMTVANLRALLKDRGIPSTGLTRKAQIIEKLLYRTVLVTYISYGSSTKLDYTCGSKLKLSEPHPCFENKDGRIQDF